MEIVYYSVFNSIHISGEKERIETFKSRCIVPAESTFLFKDWNRLIFDFNALLPLPSELNNMDYHDETFLAMYYAITGEMMEIRLWPDLSETKKQMIDANRTAFIEKTEKENPGITSKVNRAV